MLVSVVVVARTNVLTPRRGPAPPGNPEEHIGKSWATSSSIQSSSSSQGCNHVYLVSVQILLISWLVQCSRKHTLWSSQRGYGKILQPSSTLFWFNIWESPSCCASELLICNPLTKIQTYLIHLSWYLSQLWFRTHLCYKRCQKWLMLGVRYVWPMYEICMKYKKYIPEWLA